MQSETDLNRLLGELRNAFPFAYARPELEARSHAWWVAKRPELPSLLPQDVLLVLPFILRDMAETARTTRFEMADQVIFFLDVLAEPVELSDPSTDEQVRKFADEIIGGEEGEHFIETVLSELPHADEQAGPIAEDELRAQTRRQHEASFSEFRRTHAEAVYRWLRYIAGFEEYESYRVELARSAAYWFGRARRSEAR